jgi:reductive dehalogenase
VSAAGGTDRAPVRFSERYTSFAREQWDETHLARGKRARPRTDEAGFAPEDFALSTGAWAVAHRSDGMGRLWEPKEDALRAGRRASSDELTRRVKDAGRLFGAALVGVAEVNPLWLYACNREEEPIELPDGVGSAVVMAVPMEYELLRSAPSAVAHAATGNGYSRMAFTATCMAQFLNELGYRAVPCGNDTALSIPLAIDAGLGEYARNGLLVTPGLGPRVRLCKVFTDAELVADQPMSCGVREFCESCLKCADHCPANAIPRGEPTEDGPTPSNNPGIRRWFVNPDMCLAFWRVNGVGCSSCIRSCPFNKPPGRIHDWARSVVRRRSNPANRVLLWLDNALGYGKRIEPDSV